MSNRQLWIYLAKLAVGCVASFLLCYFVTFIDIRWCLVSVALVLSPETREEVTLAFTRIKANLVAAVTSMAFLLIGPASVYTVALAFIATSLLCYWLKLMNGNRSALAAVVIIMIREEQGFHWISALGRVSAVIAGCLLALGITFVFHFEFKPKLAEGASQIEHE